jgi:phospholipase A1
MNSMSEGHRGIRSAIWALLAAQALLPVVQAAGHEDCAAIDDDAERLACHDQVSGRTPPTQSQPVIAAQATVPQSETPQSQPSLLERAWGFSPDSNKYLLRYYHTNFLVPARYSDDPNDEPFVPGQALAPDAELDSIEAMFQISFRYRLWATDDRRWGFWASYTQLSHWQVYNTEVSSPFRETNYMPELFASYDPDVQFGEFKWGLLNFGYNHESNGRTQILSRSWDRLFAEVGFDNGSLALLAKAWYRIPEGSSDDDNPDITDYLGYGQLTAHYKWRDQTFTLKGGGSLSNGKGWIELSYISRPFIGPLRGYVLLYSGYGESMIDYNWKQNVVGVGIAINSPL